MIEQLPARQARAGSYRKGGLYRDAPALLSGLLLELADLVGKLPNLRLQFGERRTNSVQFQLLSLFRIRNRRDIEAQADRSDAEVVHDKSLDDRARIVGLDVDLILSGRQLLIFRRPSLP